MTFLNLSNQSVIKTDNTSQGGSFGKDSAHKVGHADNGHSGYE